MCVCARHRHRLAPCGRHPEQSNLMGATTSNLVFRGAVAGAAGSFCSCESMLHTVEGPAPACVCAGVCRSPWPCSDRRAVSAGCRDIPRGVAHPCTNPASYLSPVMLWGLSKCVGFWACLHRLIALDRQLRRHVRQVLGNTDDHHICNAQSHFRWKGYAVFTVTASASMTGRPTRRFSRPVSIIRLRRSPDEAHQWWVFTAVSVPNRPPPATASRLSPVNAWG